MAGGANHFQREIGGCLVEYRYLLLADDFTYLINRRIRHTQFQQQQLAFDVIAQCHIGDVDDVHELEQLLGNLADHLVRPDRDQRQARHVRILGRRHIERFDVVAARRK